jgi:alpha-galactosidase
MGSPLIIGCDVRKADKTTKDILLNRDIISINQDIECREAYRVGAQAFDDDEVFVLARVLSDGDIALGFFNLSDGDRQLSLPFWDLGLAYASGLSLSLYDCWEHRQAGVFREGYTALVPAHGCFVFRAKLTKAC